MVKVASKHILLKHSETEEEEEEKNGSEQNPSLVEN